MNWFYTEPKVAEILKRHFPDATDEQREKQARRIVSESNLARSFERINNSDRPSAKDIESLRKVEKNLRAASSELNELGWHGSRSLSEHAEYLAKSLQRDDIRYIGATLDSGPIFAKLLLELSEEIGDAARTTPENGDPIWFEAEHDKSDFSIASKPRKSQAKYIALKCADVFRKLSKKDPKVSTDTLTNKAYGPYFEFVTDIFEVLSVDASPETWARAAVRRKISKKV